ncbi:MAG: hypothetical protein JWN71_5008 [Xanthobacteraceae bacterium]|jgi:hypothetical protein|nr:hypothetical protein [Xanthobacteraceae bacterium]
MPVRPALLAAAFAALLASAAQAQSPWPDAGGTAAPPAGASPWPANGGNAAPPAGASPFPPAGTSPAPFPPPGGAQSPFSQQQQQPPAVCNDFVEIRTAAEKGALAIRGATQRKAPAPELCPLFKSYNANEAKMLKFMQDNKTTCGVPDQVIAQVKASYTRTTQIRNQVCNPQAAGPGRPKPPSLGDALGTPAVPTGENTKTGKGGTYDTLSGSNPLAR